MSLNAFGIVLSVKAVVVAGLDLVAARADKTSNLFVRLGPSGESGIVPHVQRPVLKSQTGHGMVAGACLAGLHVFFFFINALRVPLP